MQFNALTTLNSMDQLVDLDNRNNVVPPFSEYEGEKSFFPVGEAPLPEWVGYAVVLGFGLLFSIITTAIVYINKYFGNKGEITSEHFK